MKLKISKNNSGFSLVEMMIVVAVIGILSAVAIPSFQQYLAKSKTSESKLQLAALYTALSSWFSTYNHFATCTNVMGFDISAERANRHYSVGFAQPELVGAAASVYNGAHAACANAPAVNNTSLPSPADKAVYAYGAGRNVENRFTKAEDIAAQVPTAIITNQYTWFKIAAIGFIQNGRTETLDLADLWTMDTNKNLINVQMGYK